MENHSTRKQNTKVTCMQTENKADNEDHRLMDATDLADRVPTSEIRREMRDTSHNKTRSDVLLTLT